MFGDSGDWMGEERMSLEMAAGSGGGGFRLAAAAEEVQSDLVKRRFIGSVRFTFFLSHVSGFGSLTSSQ